MFQFLNRWRIGYLRILVAGFFSERFLNLCSANEMDVWELEPVKDGVLCCMTLPAFRRIRPLARKAKVRVRIVERFGFPFFLYRNRKRKGMFFGMVLFCALLYALSLFVWNISFEGNYHYTRETLLGFLESEGIRYGMRKKGISCEKLEEGIRSAFPEITWVSARVSGTRLLVKIKENEVLSSIPEKDNSPCDLIAEKAGTITRMVVRQGKAAVAVGDVVEPGQVLVSSELSIMNDSGEAVRTAYVHAEGDIYARTEYSYQKKISKMHTVSVKTGKRRLGAGVKAGPYQWSFLLPAWGENSWQYQSESSQLCLFEDFYLPIYFERITGEEYLLYDRSYTQDEVLKLSEQLEENYLKNLLEKGVHIIENNVKIQENGFFYIIEGEVTGEEAIARKRSVTETDQKTQEQNEETIETR